ncbi:MAG: hypothetical protein JOZ57_17650, partial [Abitibacteriaceae bacterium]|nr:hypothetical protein [Abditibacteriaceae bacterium]
MIAVRMVGLIATLIGAIICWVMSSRQNYGGHRGQQGWLLLALGLICRSVNDGLAIYAALHTKPPLTGSLKSLVALATGGYSLALQSLLLCAGFALLALSFFQSTHPPQSSGEATEIERLRNEVARRTHQLSSLHAITADLNNTLDGAHVLSTGLERMTESVQADAGAIWVRIDFVGLTETGDAAKD